MSEVERDSSKNFLCVVGAEALFILLPFVVITIVLSLKGELANIPYMPEWAIAASVLVGLALVRFTTGLFQAETDGDPLAWERVMLVFSLVITLALVPSLLVLALVLASPAHSRYLAVIQIVLFAMGLFLFIALGWTGQFFRSQPKPETQSPELAVINTRAAGD